MHMAAPAAWSCQGLFRKHLHGLAGCRVACVLAGASACHAPTGGCQLRPAQIRAPGRGMTEGINLGSRYSVLRRYIEDALAALLGAHVAAQLTLRHLRDASSLGAAVLAAAAVRGPA